jgi:hypothetical protein
MRPGSAGASGSGPNAGWSPAARPGTGSGGFPEQPPARPSFQPSFQPNGYQPGSGPAGGRPQDRGDLGERTERIDRVNTSGSPAAGRAQDRGDLGERTERFERVNTSGSPAPSRPQDRGDWGERTERIDRVDASGYPAPRAASRSQGPGLPGSSSQPMGFGPSFTGSGASVPAATPARGRGDGDPRQAPDRRDADRDGGRETGSIWSLPGRGAATAGGDDDPLTSTAYSRSALTETDGRSYRTAARLSQAQAKLTDQTDPFASGSYPQGQNNGRTGDYPAASYQQAEQRSGEYRQHRGDAPPAAASVPGGRYPSYGGQPGPGPAGPSQGQRPGQGSAPGQPGRGAAAGRPGAVSGPGPSVPGGGPPSGGLPGRQYESQHSRPSQPQRPQAQPPATPLAAPVYSGSPAPAAGAAPSGGPAGGGPAGGRHAGTGGLNPYDGTTASYPYATQAYPSRPAAPAGPVPAGPTGPGRDGDDRYRRPTPQDGYARGIAEQNRAEQNRPGQNGDEPNRTGYGAGYGSNWPASRERPY